MSRLDQYSPPPPRGVTADISDPNVTKLNTGKRFGSAKTPTLGPEGREGGQGVPGAPGAGGGKPATMPTPGGGLGAYDLVDNPYQSDASLRPGAGAGQAGAGAGAGAGQAGAVGPGTQKPGRFDAFHAYASQQLAGAGWRKSGSDKKSGWVATGGRFKGLTQDEVDQKMRQEYGKFGADKRAGYESLARGDDIASGGKPGDLVARTGGREPTVGNASFSGLDEVAAYQGRNRGLPGRDRPLTAQEGVDADAADKLLQGAPAEDRGSMDLDPENRPSAGTKQPVRQSAPDPETGLIKAFNEYGSVSHESGSDALMTVPTSQKDAMSRPSKTTLSPERMKQMSGTTPPAETRQIGPNKWVTSADPRFSKA